MQKTPIMIANQSLRYPPTNAETATFSAEAGVPVTLALLVAEADTEPLPLADPVLVAGGMWSLADCPSNVDTMLVLKDPVIPERLSGSESEHAWKKTDDRERELRRERLNGE